MKTHATRLWVLSGLSATALTALGQLPVPTGNAELDFPASDPDVYIKSDFDGTTPNIGLPGTAPPGAVSGWDIKDLRFKFFNLPGGEVVLGVGFNAFGILGDADGNGDPSTSAQWLRNSGGDDIPDLGLSESLVLMLDVDEDGTPDAAVGVKPGESLVIEGVRIETSKPDLQNPPGSFDGPFSSPGPYVSDVSPSPDAASPDLVFFIRNFQDIPPSSGLNNDDVFFVMGWMGSQDDAGIGEDFAPFFNGFTSVRGSIGNTIYCDRDGDGFFGPGDEPVEDVLVDLYDGSGNYVGSSITSEFGFYVFMDLVGDDYTVELAPENFAPGGVLAGFVQTTDRSASPLDGANRSLPYLVPLGNGEDHFFADFGFVCERSTGGEGCTPGFWKQSHHLQYWTDYSPDQSFSDVFGVGPHISLLEAMNRGGGGEAALGRHAVAALLNATSPAVNYLYGEAGIMTLVQGAYASGRFNSVKDQLEEQNQLGCDGVKGHDGPKGDDHHDGPKGDSHGDDGPKGDGHGDDSPKSGSHDRDRPKDSSHKTTSPKGGSPAAGSPKGGGHHGSRSKSQGGKSRSARHAH